ncbi:MAG: hypothetical protein HY433_03065 [Candidatus Liptonbacteria bacterium]|nr:hypothetical protein [Candidatus Liptonbacteria bacterium]
MNPEKSNKPPFHYRLLWGIVLILAAINVALIVILFRFKNQVADSAMQAANILRQAQALSSDITLATDIMIDDKFNIPIKTVIPIKTTVNIPVAIPIIGQTVILKVPIDTTVPIDIAVNIPVKKSVPLNVKISNMPFNGILNQFQDWLAALAIRFGSGGK